MKIIAIGRNYADHIQELENERPDEPVIFLKPDTAVLKDNAPFYHPAFSSNIHHELELTVRISKEGKHIKKEFASSYYDAIGIGIDFTARDLQQKLKEKGLPWEKAKAFNHSAPISKFISVDKFENINNLEIQLDVNGETRQKAKTNLMLYGIDEIMEHVSQLFTLRKGDIIFTGTPAGVGKINIGDRLVGFLEGEKLLDFEIK